MKKFTCFFFLLICNSAIFTASAQSKSSLPPGLDAYVNHVLQTFEVPGMCMAIVKDGKVLLTKGYGVKTLGEKEPVDEHTLFPIASNSKAFTAVALGLLVEEGKIDWDDPVIEHLPWFRIGDAYITNQITIRDLLVHRSGLAPYAGDLLQFPPSTYSRKEIVKRIRWLPMSNSFRSSYAYDNLLYLAAGELIEAVSGLEWEGFVQSRILDKLGMTETVSRISKFKTRKNVSASHARFDGEVRIVHNFSNGVGDVTDPAGGIVSNATDMAKWMMMHLDSGRTKNGNRLFGPSVTKELWTGVTPMPIYNVPDDLEPFRIDFNSYGLGFVITNYRNHKSVMHGGKLDGFVSRVLFIPDMKIGITVLTNQESSAATYAIINHILDYFMQAPAFDWVSGYKHKEDRRFARIEKIENARTLIRNSQSKPSLSLLQYAGTYKDSWYGSMSITKEGNKLVMRFDHTPGMVGDMEHFQYNTFIVKWRNRELKADAFVTFALLPNGKIDQVKMKAVSPITDISYDFRDLLFKPVLQP